MTEKSEQLENRVLFNAINYRGHKHTTQQPAIITTTASIIFVCWLAKVSILSRRHVDNRLSEINGPRKVALALVCLF